MTSLIEAERIQALQRKAATTPRPAPLPWTAKRPGRHLRPSDRQHIELATVGLVNAAFTAFAQATLAHADAIKAAAKAEAEMVAAVIDVATGFLAPVFAGYVAEKLVAKTASLAISEEAKLFAKNVLLSKDSLKAAFSGATKTASTYLKLHANALFGEQQVDAFALLLRTQFHHAAAEIFDHIGSLSSRELIAIWAAYQPDYADEPAYRASLASLFASWKEQVEPIGSESRTVDGSTSVTMKSRLYYVRLSAGTRLALLTDSTVLAPAYSRQEHGLWAWISPDMEAIALGKAKALGQKVETIPLSALEGVTLADLIDPPLPTDQRLALGHKPPVEIVRSLSPSQRAAARANPDFMHVIETQVDYFGYHLDDDQRHQAIYLLKGYSEHVVDSIDAMSGIGTDRKKLFASLEAMSTAELQKLGKERWFVDRIRDEWGLDYDELARALLMLGVTPPPKPEPLPVGPPVWRR